MVSTSQQVVIWGASGHALVVADILRLQGDYRIAGYLDSISLERRGEAFGGGTVLGGHEQLDQLKNQGINNIALAIGNCAARLELADTVVELGFSLVSAIHPSAIIANGVNIGGGSVLCAGCVINPEARIGRATIINTCASVDHECILQDGVHISPGVHLGGNVKIGRGSSIGVGSAVRDGINIGENCVIGAGSTVVSDIASNVLAYGVPARVISNR